MVKIKILKDDVKGSDDGATVRSYPTDGGSNKDGVYDVSADLANALVNGEEAEFVDEARREPVKTTEIPVVPTPPEIPTAIPEIPGIPATAKRK